MDSRNALWPEGCACPYCLSWPPVPVSVAAVHVHNEELATLALTINYVRRHLKLGLVQDPGIALILCIADFCFPGSLNCHIIR